MNPSLSLVLIITLHICFNTLHESVFSKSPCVFPAHVKYSSLASEELVNYPEMGTQERASCQLFAFHL